MNPKHCDMEGNKIEIADCSNAQGFNLDKFFEKSREAVRKQIERSKQTIPKPTIKQLSQEELDNLYTVEVVFIVDEKTITLKTPQELLPAARSKLISASSPDKKSIGDFEIGQKIRVKFKQTKREYIEVERISVN